MAQAPAATPPATVPKKGPNPAVTALKKGLEKADAARKATNQKLRDARESGRFGRAAVDTLEAGAGGAFAGALDAVISIPIGEERHYRWVEVVVDEKGDPTGVYLDKNGKPVAKPEDALRGTETQQLSIPIGAPLGLVLVAGGAWAEQADAVEIGKGMFAGSAALMANTLAKTVKEMFAA